MTKRNKRPLPVQAEHETTTWVYWISRDSIDGVLSAKCSLWHERPLRTHCGNRATWTSSHGHLGQYRPDDVAYWFRTYPATDRELIRVETRPSKEQLEEAKRQGKVV